MGNSKFFYETHLHTLESSRCGRTPGRLMARHHAELNFTGIFVTDHFVTGNSHGNINASWHERIDKLYEGYLNAKKEGDTCGLDVFFAWEFPYEGGDFLTYGLDIAFLYAHPELAEFSDRRDFADYAHLVHENGGMIVQAHPYREAVYIPNGRAVVQEQYIDAIEVINGSHADPRFDQGALQKAKELNLPMTAGSDTHSIDMSETGYMAFDHRLKDSQDFIDQVGKKNYTLIRKEDRF